MTEIRCDFCSSPEIRFSFPTRSFEHEVLPGLPPQGSAGGWAACLECHDLIVKGDWEGLAKHTLESPHREFNPTAASRTERRIIERGIRRLHRKFRQNRLGDPVLLGDDAEFVPPTGWEGVLDIQMDLARWWGTEEGERWGRAWAADTQAKYGDLPPALQRLTIDERRAVLQDEPELAHGRDWLARLAEMERFKLLHAIPWYVGDNVMSIIEAARDDFRPEALLPEDVPTPSGFLVLPRALTTIDARDEAVTNRAYLWAPIAEAGSERGGIALSVYTYTPDEPILHALTGQMGGVQANWTLLGAHVIPWGDEEATQILATARDFQVILRLANQTVTTTTSSRPSRAAARRAKRAGMENDLVNVLRLRQARKPHDDGERQSVEWTCRWLVRGHWRNQFFSSADAHRQIWISPHVKGPEEKELRVKPRQAVEFVR